MLEKFEIPEKKKSELWESFARFRVTCSAILYTVMVFVVIYGMSADVYAGFPTPIPYIIIAIFLFMAFVRLYQSLVSDAPVKKKSTKKAKAAKNKEASKDRHEQEK